jgi:hypothetical protein
VRADGCSRYARLLCSMMLHASCLIAQSAVHTAVCHIFQIWYDILILIENSGSCAGKWLCNNRLWFCSREFTTLKGISSDMGRWGSSDECSAVEMKTHPPFSISSFVRGGKIPHKTATSSPTTMTIRLLSISGDLHRQRLTCKGKDTLGTAK